MGVGANEITGDAPRKEKLVPRAGPSSQAVVVGFNILEGAYADGNITQKPRGKPTPPIIVRDRIVYNEIRGEANSDAIILGLVQFQPLPFKLGNIVSRIRGVV